MGTAVKRQKRYLLALAARVLELQGRFSHTAFAQRDQHVEFEHAAPLRKGDGAFCAEKLAQIRIACNYIQIEIIVSKTPEHVAQTGCEGLVETAPCECGAVGEKPFEYKIPKFTVALVKLDKALPLLIGSDGMIPQQQPAFAIELFVE